MGANRDNGRDARRRGSRDWRRSRMLAVTQQGRPTAVRLTKESSPPWQTQGLQSRRLLLSGGIGQLDLSLMAVSATAALALLALAHIGR